jgi:hypothetical protein
MREIQGEARTVNQLLRGVKYSVDYYQREYKWETKQIAELVKDLTSQFLEDYQPEHERRRVAEYSHYFLGSIIMSNKDGTNYIVDGQQRLTSLTLLLIYLRRLQQELNLADKVNIDDLIFSERYGEKSFNLQIEDRTTCMKALFDGDTPDYTNGVESVRNLVARYSDIEQEFPDELRGPALPYFMDWLVENVHLVRITAYSDEDAYTIFETMNDRGLSLTATEMLKSYLLSSITDPDKQEDANKIWKSRIATLNALGKNTEADAIKAWLRSQHSTKIREHRKGATPEDFDRIGAEFHRWVQDSSDSLGLTRSNDFFRFIQSDFEFYTRQYMRVVRASVTLTPGLEHIRYNADHGFTLQNMLLLAPLCPDDDDDVIRLKLSLTAHFVDILISRRIWNFHSIAYSTMQYSIFRAMKEIRGLQPVDLAQRLHSARLREPDTFASNDRLRVHQQNRYYLHRILARITDYVETQSGNESRYDAYVSDSGRNRFEVEHIWANVFARHTDEFSHSADFAEYRNRIGGLLILPKQFNSSYGALAYEDKLEHYNTQNLLARSLHPLCYEHNPGFLSFVSRSGLPFRPHEHFTKADLEERGELYRMIAERIWNPDDLLREAGI